MALFVVRHQHAAERCPAQDPYSGAMLLNHLSRPNVRRHGVQIQGEAVVQGEHTLYLIVEADDESRVREFMQPFQMAGSLDIYPASTCARVVASGGGCRAAGRRFVPALDPEGACQQAIDAGLVVPSSASAQLRDVHPCARRRRGHAERAFLRPQSLPDPDARCGRVPAEGRRLVERPLSLRCATCGTCHRRRWSSRWSAPATAALFDPPVDGEKWDLGAVSTAEWTGRAAVEVLDRAGVQPSARSCCSAAPTGEPWTVTRSRSVSSAASDRSTREAEALLAYAMNGEPLPFSTATRCASSFRAGTPSRRSSG